MTFAKYLAFVSVLGACARQPFIANTGPSRTVTVEIESNEPRSVFARIAGSSVATATGAGGTVTAGATEYENICTGSCTAEIDPQQSYVFLGVSGWQHRSSSFVIHTNSDRYKLRLDSGSQSGWMWGFAGVVFGAAMTVGGVTLAASATDQYDTGTGGSDLPSRPPVGGAGEPRRKGPRIQPGPMRKGRPASSRAPFGSLVGLRRPGRPG